MNFMRIAVAAVFVVGWAAFAHADTISFDPDGPANANPFLMVASFDEAPGNILNLGSVTAITVTFPANDTNGNGEFDPGEVPTTFDVLFQARIGALIGPGGALVVPGLNEPPYGAGATTPGFTPFELTVVARFTEQILAVSTIGGGTVGIATFRVVPSATAFFELWFDDGTVLGATPSSDLAGTGFNDGTIILTGTISTSELTTFVSDLTPPFPNLDNFPTGDDDYPLIDTLVGSGGTNDISGPVTGAHPGFFGVTPPSFISVVLTDTFNATPFDSVEPSDMFAPLPTGPVGTAAVGVTVDIGADTTAVFPANSIGPVNGISGPDFQVESDAQTEFSVTQVPEPSAIVLSAIGCVALGLVQRKRSRRKVA